LIYDGFDRQVKRQFPSIAAPPATFNSATQFSALTTSGEPNAGDREEYRYDANGNRTWLRIFSWRVARTSARSPAAIGTRTAASPGKKFVRDPS
jgi:hypothetical protein